MYLLIRTCPYIHQWQNTIKKLPSYKTDAFHCLYTYLLYLYTTLVVWQTKCKFVMCITRLPCVLTGSCAHPKTTCKSACVHQFLSFTHRKNAGTLVYWHTCVKFKLSCIVVCPLVFHSINWPPCFEQRCHNLIYHKHLYEVLTRNNNKQLG